MEESDVSTTASNKNLWTVDIESLLQSAPPADAAVAVGSVGVGAAVDA